MRGMSQESIDAFWSKVDRPNPDDCWNWLGARKPKGYGNVRINGSYMLAHRVAWELSNFDIPDGYFVCHACDNPSCCNPKHLMLGSAKANFVDMVSKGREGYTKNKAIGERNFNSRLNRSAVLAIRTAYANKEKDQRQLAEEFGVSQSAISAVLRNKTWSHVNVQ